MTCKILALVLICLPGCGPQVTPRYELSGKVTYGGKSVPAGSMVFSPDGNHGNRGPGAMTSIEAGGYRLPPERGSICGPHVVTITGFDGVATQEGPGINPIGKPLFSAYQFHVDLQRERATLDFEVPNGRAGR